MRPLSRDEAQQDARAQCQELGESQYFVIRWRCDGTYDAILTDYLTDPHISARINLSDGVRSREDALQVLRDGHEQRVCGWVNTAYDTGDCVWRYVDGPLAGQLAHVRPPFLSF